VVTDRVRAGVVQLSTGAWYDPVDSGVPGTLDKHGNANMLTLDKGTSKVGQGPSALSALVEIEPHSGPVPPVSVLTAPTMADA
jgi:biotin/methionine sulfoxide reductase